MKKNRTISVRECDVKKKWHLIDAQDQTLGRLATRVATLIRGKHKAIFTPHVDTGDFVIVVNAEKIKVTGKKAEAKYYFHHSGYPGGAKMESFKKVLAAHPDRIIRHAVRGMLPKGRLGERIAKKLKVYAGKDHPHAAQMEVKK